ncbi:hypothetical protein K435DRAFT_868356 [Dendrothele bispora CBS 962.96]|uniref:DUF6532 domain-containing protein n=1 Tax=Dendrothele bispora (strain CBS 962.96) TaxID=1314807 RepID=A0A4S8LDD8_DENBC|nr:hypothetical protein K435DRAFT_868356 [Dendrothele bispora CBS 962.96]
MFFGTTLYSGVVNDIKNTFTSSVGAGDKANELELPKAMVALATAAIHAVLQDFAKGTKEDFPTKELDGVWNTALHILGNLKNVNPNRYHRLMHDLYCRSAGGLALATHGLSNQQIFDTVDWSALVKDDGSGDLPITNATQSVSTQAVTPTTKS